MHAMGANMKFSVCMIFAVMFCMSARAAEVLKIEIWDGGHGSALLINGEAIGKREIEEHMGDMALRLRAYKKEKIANKQWNSGADSEWTRLYVDGFRDALRKVVRERLMIQEFDREKLTVDAKELEIRAQKMREAFAADGKRNVSADDIQSAARDHLKVELFRKRFNDSVEKENAWFIETVSKSKILRTDEGAPKNLRSIFSSPRKR